jgi:predicted metal-dependent hydrolase
MLPWFIAVMLPTTTVEILRLMARDGSLKDLRTLRTGLASLLGRRGLLTASLPAILDYFRPGFHPSQDDQTALEMGWRRELGML